MVWWKILIRGFTCTSASDSRVFVASNRGSIQDSKECEDRCDHGHTVVMLAVEALEMNDFTLAHAEGMLLVKPVQSKLAVRTAILDAIVWYVIKLR